MASRRSNSTRQQTAQARLGRAFGNREHSSISAGIAKGWALDDALEVLRKHQITRALIDAGGDVRAGEPPPGTAGWRVILAPFDEREDALGTILLRDAAVATSGGRWQTIEIEGRRYAHLLDPKTGLGLRHRVAASVIAKNATDADALATALCIMPPQEGRALARKSQAECAILLERNNELKLHESECFRKLLEAK